MLQLKTVKIILLSTFITGLTAIHGFYEKTGKNKI